MSIKILSKNIKNIRKANGITQKEMAKRLGIGVGSLSKLENGSLPPRLNVDILFTIEREFKVKAHLLLVENTEI